MFDFTIKPDNGDEYKVTAGTRDVLVWEKTTRGVSIHGLLRDWEMVHLYRLAHIASRRLGLFTGDLAQFEETCELEARETPAADPTQPAP